MFTYKNSEGKKFTLYYSKIELKNGQKTKIYFFSSEKPKTKCRLAPHFPKGYEVIEMEKAKWPLMKRKVIINESK